MVAGGSVVLVDGYNVLRSSGRYSAYLARSDDYAHDVYNAAREALLNDVAGFVGRDGRAIIVFDGAGNPESAGEPRRIANIEVIFSPSGVSADAVIEGLAQRERQRGAKVLVVTSDAQTQWAVLGSGVTRMSAATFAGELAALDDERRTDAAQSNVKTTLAERLNAETRQRLESLRGELL
ncbi:MAG: NYN domain-containing protein [Coriobacteriales bacterium]|jgi:predicted RNA-binding protein with PIN domain|nr:NYN domain-containing protein [Coriobacteriales bacterium]